MSTTYDIEENNSQQKGGDRWNKSKLEWSLVHFKSLEAMVRVLMFGKQKYAEYNWAKGLSVKQILESQLRHTMALLAGEDLDPESGLPHYAHMQCNDMFVAYMLENKKEFDDRWKDILEDPGIQHSPGWPDGASRWQLGFYDPESKLHYWWPGGNAMDDASYTKWINLHVADGHYKVNRS